MCLKLTLHWICRHFVKALWLMYDLVVSAKDGLHDGEDVVGGPGDQEDEEDEGKCLCCFSLLLLFLKRFCDENIAGLPKVKPKVKTQRVSSTSSYRLVWIWHFPLEKGVGNLTMIIQMMRFTITFFEEFYSPETLSWSYSCAAKSYEWYLQPAGKSI